MSRRGWVLFVVMSIVWGIPYLLIKVSDEAISPAAFVFIRTAVAALMLVPYAAIRGQLRPAIQHWRAVLVFAAVEIAIPWVFLAQAEKRLPSSLTGLLIAAVPIVGTLLVRVTGERHHLGAGGLLGLAVGMAGVGVLVGFDIHGADVASAGEVAIVVLGYAIGPFMVSRYLADVPGAGVIALSLLVTTIVYTPAGIIDLPSRFPPGRVVASIVTLAVVCTAAAFLIFFELIAEVGPVRATVITFVNPAVAVLLGVALLGDAFTVATGLGFVLVLGGSVLSTRGNRQAQAEPAYTEPVAGVAPGLGSEVQTSSQVSIAIADPSPAPDGWRPTGGSAG